jgi:hypothetical protein
MFDDKLQANVLTAVEARDHVAELEINVWRHVFVMTAVTEIASLNGELFGANAG